MNWNFVESCPNEAVKLLYRHATEEEQEHRDFDGISSTLPVIKQRFVCNEHLEEAKKEYPLTANTEL